MYIGVIAWKEVRSYLSSPMAYIVTAVFLAISGTSFVMYLAGTGYADTSLRGFLDAGQVLILLFAALLTMRLVAEERKLGTWELMLTLPVSETEIILGKFIGAVTILSGMLALTLYYPLLLALFGDPDPGPIITGYAGLFLLGCASLSVGLFASSVTSNQIVAAVLAGGMLFALWFLGAAAEFVPAPFNVIVAYLSPSTHFPGFARGIVDTRALVYYISLVSLFLFLSIRSLELERWR